jgi:hypothetical protein
MKFFMLYMVFGFSILFSKAQEPIITWNNANTKPDLQQDVQVFPDQAGGYLLVNTMPPAEGSFSPSVTAEYFSAANERKYKKNVTVEMMEDYVQVVLLNNTAYLLKSLFNKEAGKNTLTAVPITAEGSYGQPIVLASMPAEKLAARGQFKASCSSDGSKLVVLAEPNFTKDANEKIGIYVFNSKLEKTSESTQTFSYPSTRAVFNEPHINNNGMIFLLKKTDMKGEGITYSIFSFNGSSLKEFKMAFDGNKKAATLVSNMTNEGDFIVAGYYTEDAKVKIGFGTAYHGSFVYKLNATGEKWLANAINPFEKRKDILARKVISYKNNTILLGEITYTNSSARTGGSDPFARDYSYSGLDIMVDGFDATGKPIYAQSIKKNNSSKNDYARWNSFFGDVINGKLYFIFMDDKTRYEEKKKWIVFGTVPKIAVYATVDPITGSLTATKPIENYDNPGNKEKAMLLRPEVCVPLSENNFIIRAENADLYRMGKISF